MLISVGEIIDRSWHHYTKHFIELMSVAAWLLIVALVSTIATWLYPAVSFGNATHLTGTELIGIILYAITFLIITPIVSTWVFNTTARLIDRQAQNKPLSLREVSHEGWHFFFPRLLVEALVVVCVGAPVFLMIPGLVLSILSNQTAPVLAIPGSILFLLGIFASLILSFTFVFRLFFSSYQLLLENKRGRGALRASWQLIKGRGWRAFWRLIVPKIIFYFGLFTLQMFLVFLLKILATNLAGLNFDLGVRIYAIGSTTVFIVLGALINPLIMTADYLLFRSLQENS